MDKKEKRKLINRKEVAEMLGVTTRTVQNWEKNERGLPVKKISPRCYRYDPDEVQRWASGSDDPEKVPGPPEGNKCPTCGGLLRGRICRDCGRKAE
jgi:predicted DNA-binding transcriptional regulator AlpA